MGTKTLGGEFALEDEVDVDCSLRLQYMQEKNFSILFFLLEKFIIIMLLWMCAWNNEKATA